MHTSTTPPQRPNANDRYGWSAYWKALDQPWRTEPEIDADRQNYLKKCLAIVPDPIEEQYPFKDIVLSRADVEWLLATRGDESKPINLRACILQKVSLSGLPLEGANLIDAHLEDAYLYGVHLEGANLSGVRLEMARLDNAHLEGANLSGVRPETTLLRKAPPRWANLSGVRPETAFIGEEAHLEGAQLIEAHLEGARLVGAHLEEAYLQRAHLEGAELALVHLEGATLWEAHLEGAFLVQAHLEGAKLNMVYLEGANLAAAHLEGAELDGAHLEKAYLFQTHLEGANLRETHLEGANLHGAFFSGATNLDGIVLGNKQAGFASLAGVRWNEVDLSEVDWTSVSMLGDEQLAHRRKEDDGKIKSAWFRLKDYQTAVRADRQLAIALQTQGLNEQATRFAYRAQVLQRRVYWFEMVQPKVKLKQRVQALSDWLFSWFLFLLTGYGYLLWHSFLTYFLTISFFMTIYHIIDPQLAWSEAFVVSMTAFHGRGFSPSTFIPGDPLSFVSAAEAFVGLIIEVTFIATLTQRFFRK
jgi:uncharacterized protein YjbI with pentapeptide repeats